VLFTTGVSPWRAERIRAQWCCTLFTQLSRSCYTVVTLLLHYCYTVVTTCVSPLRAERIRAVKPPPSATSWHSWSFVSCLYIVCYHIVYDLCVFVYCLLSHSTRGYEDQSSEATTIRHILMLHCCYTAGILLLHCCYTVVTLLLHCCDAINKQLHCCHTVVTSSLLWCYSSYTVVTLVVTHCCHNLIRAGKPQPSATSWQQCNNCVTTV
jgi:hypothetical protein